ncbi:MAG: hypothetical protein GEU75_10255 [Dehalococcoidia bacterium]|nr:hypothetical protein [Dehalococcoidia bacterium]
MFSRILIYTGCLAVLPVAALAVGCGDDDEDLGDPGASDAGSADEMLVEQTISEAIAAYDRQDLTAFLAFFTDDGIEDQFDATRQQIQAAADEFFSGPPQLLRGFADTEVDGDEATTEVEWAIAQSIQKEEYELVREDSGPWKINGSESITVAIPSGTNAVDVDLDEFSFEFDMEDIEDGNLAFRADNVGEQPHELVVLKVPAGFTATQLIDSLDADLPADIEIIGFTQADPADDMNLVFTQPLAPGRYMMACFLPDQDDPQEAPHAAKGMISEFTISSQGGN